MREETECDLVPTPQSSGGFQPRKIDRACIVLPQGHKSNQAVDDLGLVVHTTHPIDERSSNCG